MFYLGLILAGGLGTLCRYLVTRLSVGMNWTALPYGTIAVNVFGSFLMGYLSYLLIEKWQLSRELQAVVLTGFLGGFTTFSAFSIEMVMLLEQGFLSKAFVYALSTMFLCLLMCFLGLLLARYSLSGGSLA